jgi:hypothetical protein
VLHAKATEVTAVAERGVQVRYITNCFVLFFDERNDLSHRIESMNEIFDNNNNNNNQTTTTQQVLRDSSKIASHRWDPDTTVDLYYDIARGYRSVSLFLDVCESFFALLCAL